MKKNKVFSEEKEEKIKKSLDASIQEGVMNSSSQSIYSTYLAPLALALGATNFHIGLLETAQQVATTAGQIPGAKLTQYYSRKSIWLLSQFVGKFIFWLPLVFIPFLNLSEPVILIIIFASVSAFFLSIRGPAWSSLMGDLVPQEKRGVYFGKRNMIIGIAGVVATMIAGLLISFLGFSFIFLIAIILGAFSIPLFMRMWEPPTERVYHYKYIFELNPRNWIVSIRVNKAFFIFVSYSVIFNFAVMIAAPFYTVYMLKNLSISYELFAFLTILGAIVRIFSFKYWGHFNDRFGSRKILIVTGFFGCFVPFGWMLSSNAWHIAIVKIFDGFIFAGFDLVAFNYLLDVTPAKKRPQYIANYNLFVGIGIIFGALIGGILADSLSNSYFGWLYGLQIIFFLSFVLRLFASILLSKLREMSISEKDIMPVKYVFMRTIAIEPINGIKRAIEYTFRYPFDRDSEYKRSIKRLYEQRKIEKFKFNNENKKTPDKEKK